MIWNILLGALFIGAARYGDYIGDECPQAGYVCPKICDVDHKHFPREECEKKTKKEKGNIMPTSKECIKKGLKKGTAAYDRCVEYKEEFEGLKGPQVKRDINYKPPRKM